MLKQTKKVLEVLAGNKSDVSLESVNSALSEIEDIKKISVEVPVSEYDIESVFKSVVNDDKREVWSFESNSGQQVDIIFLKEE